MGPKCQAREIMSKAYLNPRQVKRYQTFQEQRWPLDVDEILFGPEAGRPNRSSSQRRRRDDSDDDEH